MEAEGTELKTTDLLARTSDIEQTGALAARLAWDVRDYKTLARVNRTLLDSCPDRDSRAKMSQAIREAGCPINYVPVA